MIFQNILKELYWLGIFIFASYIVVAVNSSFNLNEPIQICSNPGSIISKISIIFQLTALLVGVRLLYNYTLKVENYKTRAFLLPIVVFALPISIVILWTQLIGC